jgi:hypothetical protein
VKLGELLKEVITQWGYGRRAEAAATYSLAKWIITAALVVFIIVGGLTYVGKLSGESATFVAGILVGALLMLIPNLRQRPPQQGN